MTPAAIKICGVSTVAAIDAAVRGGARYIGFVHFQRSPRHLSPAQLSNIAPRVPPGIGRVAVLVDADDITIDALISAGSLTALQLHGRETPARAAEIRARTGLAVWKAIPVRTRADLAAGSAYEGAADMLLYDAKTPDGAALPGGMGMRFDWSLLAGHRPPLPWGLSGGLDPDNVAAAIRETGAPLVDISSGVEDAPGVKNVDKINAFCKAVAAL